MAEGGEGGCIRDGHGNEIGHERSGNVENVAVHQHPQPKGETREGLTETASGSIPQACAGNQMDSHFFSIEMGTRHLSPMHVMDT